MVITCFPLNTVAYFFNRQLGLFVDGSSHFHSNSSEDVIPDIIVHDFLSVLGNASCCVWSPL